MTAPATTACPICDQPAADTSERVYDDRYGYPGQFSLHACGGCGHRWIPWRPDDATLAALYSDYYPRASRSADDFEPLRPGHPLRAWWAGRRASAALWVPPRVRVLDIGCGFGEALAYHRQRGCDAHGVEADRNVARVAARFGLAVRVGLFEPGAYEPRSFDYVTMDQVIEHMVDPVATLRGVSTVLRPGGHLILSTPNASGAGAAVFRRRWINWHAPYHLHAFTRRSLAAAAAAAALQVEAITTVTSSEWINYQWIHLLTAPPPGQRSPFWSTAKGSVPSRLAIRSLRGLHRLGLDHALTRLGDRLGIGDNLVVRLRQPG